MPPPVATEDPITLLRSRGLRVTRPRLRVLDALGRDPHQRAEQVIAAVRRDGEVSVQAVYDVLNTLTEHGLLRRIQPRGSVARYELETGDNHHHLVCRSCGGVTDVACAAGEAPCLDLPATTSLRGYAVDEAEVTWWGVCPTCDTSTTHRDGARRRARPEKE